MASRYCVGDLDVKGPLYIGDSSIVSPNKYARINRPLEGTWQARNSIEDLGLLGTIVSSFELVHSDFVSEYSRTPFYTVTHGDIIVTNDLAIYTEEAVRDRPVDEIEDVPMMCRVTRRGLRTRAGHDGGQYNLQLKAHGKDTVAIRIQFV